MRVLSLLFYLFLLIVGIGFSVLNTSSVAINLYYKTYALPVSLLLVLAFGIGMLCGLLFFVFKYLRLKFAFSRLQSQLNISEKEIKNLRSIPIQDQH